MVKLKGSMIINIIKVVVVIAILVCIAVIVIGKRGTAAPEETPLPDIYEYTTEEKELAKQVKEYLSQSITSSDVQNARIADAAVKSYRIVLESGAVNGEVSEEHTSALTQRMLAALKAESLSEDLTEEDLQAIAEGICQIIWDHVLLYLQASASINEALYQTESIQKQIDELKNKNTSFKITANIENGVSQENLNNTEESLLTKMESSFSDLQSQIMEDVGNKYDSISNGKDGKDGASGNAGENGKDGSAGKDGRDGRDGNNGTKGTDGKDGISGKDGVSGKDGTDGENGKDGLSTYYMFSEYENGRNGGTTTGEISMSNAQSNTTRYMGIAHSSEAAPPQNPESYVWSEYKDYIIYSEVDDQGVPTLYIQ